MADIHAPEPLPSNLLGDCAILWIDPYHHKIPYSSGNLSDGYLADETSLMAGRMSLTQVLRKVLHTLLVNDCTASALVDKSCCLYL